MSGFDGLRASLKRLQHDALSRGSGIEERLLAFSHEMFAHANEYRDVFRAMVGKPSGAVVEQLLHKILLDLVRDDVKATAPRSDSGSLPVETVARFIAGGLFGLLNWWLNGKMRLSVEEVNRVFRRLAIPALEASRH